jgi:hypothetical protein
LIVQARQIIRGAAMTVMIANASYYYPDEVGIG